MSNLLHLIDKYVIRSITDSTGKIIEVSEAFCKISKYSKEELIGKNHSILRDPDMSSSVFRDLWATIKSGKKWHGTIKNRAKDGTFYWVDANIEPNYINGEIATYTAIRTDITDKILLEELNTTLNEKIKVEVEKSTKQLEHIQTEQLKSTKLSSIGSLAAGITHEINTPLTYIKGNFEMMQYDFDALPPSKIKDRILEDSKVIHEGIKRITNIVEAMREVSSISTEVKEKVNLYGTLVTSLIVSNNRSKQVTQIYLNKNLFDINKDKNEYSFIAFVQEQRIEQVWIIIISNALDALAKKEHYTDRRLNIDIFSDDDKIIIEISDNAGGIDKKVINNIFEPFVSTKKSGGIGIGLNIAKKIIEENNGKISVINRADGALFRVKFNKI